MKVILTICLMFLLSACLVSKPNVVAVHESGDENMNCQQIAAAKLEAERAKAGARADDKFSAKNMAGGLLFGIPVFFSASNMSKAENAANDRIAYLGNLSMQKNCTF